MEANNRIIQSGKYRFSVNNGFSFLLPNSSSVYGGKQSFGIQCTMPDIYQVYSSMEVDSILPEKKLIKAYIQFKSASI